MQLGLHLSFSLDYPEGEMSKNQFEILCKEILPSVGSVDRFAGILFDTFDASKSGALDFENFMLGVQLTAEGSVEEKCDFAFRLYDIDSDGKIQFHEMKM